MLRRRLPPPAAPAAGRRCARPAADRAGMRRACAWCAGGGAALAERAGAVGMAAALDEEMNLKEQARVVFCLLEKHGGMAAALDEMTVKEEVCYCSY